MTIIDNIVVVTWTFQLSDLFYNTLGGILGGMIYVTSFTCYALLYHEDGKRSRLGVSLSYLPRFLDLHCCHIDHTAKNSSQRIVKQIGKLESPQAEKQL